HQPQVRLVHQRGRLQGLAGLFVGQLVGRELAQLVVDQRQELRGGLRVALLDGGQDAGDVAHSVRRHAGTLGDDRIMTPGGPACPPCRADGGRDGAPATGGRRGRSRSSSRPSWGWRRGPGSPSWWASGACWPATRRAVPWCTWSASRPPTITRS